MSATTPAPATVLHAFDKLVRLTWRDGHGFDVQSGLGGRVEIVADDDTAGLRPTEAILVALGGCTGADVASILRKKRQPVGGYVVEVSGQERAEHPQVFTRIDVLHRLDGEWIDPEAVRRSIELSVTRYCPVTAQLASGEAAITHHYRIGDGPIVTVAETGPFGHLVVHADGDV
jgi:putative redox protein